MSTLTDVMHIEEAIFQKYQVAGTEEYCKEQINKIIAVIDHIQNVDWNDAPNAPNVDLDQLASDIRKCFFQWVDAREEHLPSLRQERWTNQFVLYTDKLLESVDLINTQLQAKQATASTQAYLKYETTKNNYMHWLQHIFDVPTIDDKSMQYNKKDDPSGVQMSLQQDPDFINILYIAGLYILWLDEDYFNPSTHMLPALFNDMHEFYHAILDKLSESASRESTPETQPMSSEQSIEASSLQEAKFNQGLQIKSWLHQLEHIFSDEST
jgi:hypothetical protein